PSLVETAARQRHGITLTVERIGPGKAVLRDVTMGETLHIGRLTLSYSPITLALGHLRGVIVEDAELRGTERGGHISFGPLDRFAPEGPLVPPSPGGKAEPWNPSLKRLTLRKCRLLIGEDLRAEANLHLDQKGGGFRLSGNFLDMEGRIRRDGEAYILEGTRPFHLDPPQKLYAGQGLPKPARLTWSGEGEAPPVLSLLATKGGIELRTASRLAAQGNGWNALLILDGTGLWTEPAMPSRLSLRQAELVAGNAQGLTVALRADPSEGLDIPLSVVLDSDSRGPRGFQAEGHGLLRLSTGRATFTLDQPGRVTAKDIALGDLAIEAGRLTLDASGQPLLDLGESLRVDAPISNAMLGGTLADSRFTLALPKARLGAENTAEGLRPFLTVGDGRLALPETGFVLDRIAIDSPPAAQRGTLTARLSHHAPQAAIIPLALSAEFTAPGLKGLAFDGRLRDEAGRLDLRLRGRHAGRGGQAALSLTPLDFAPDKLQPGALSPMAGLFKDVSGRLALSGPIQWTGGRITSDLKLLVKDLSGTAHGVPFRKLNTVLRVSRLFPLSTPPHQEAAVVLVDAGLPLTDGKLSFALDGGRLAVESASLTMAGGKVHLGRTMFDPAADKPQAVTLDVREVDLGRLIEVLELDGLAATGRVSGTLPVILDAEGAK
ncbi:MAG: YdbH domain-containing protein, partial [Rhodospirillales bacterium]|nr:YdbH domain-containing protein [Rhodospirillales bacterium]